MLIIALISYGSDDVEQFPRWNLYIAALLAVIALVALIVLHFDLLARQHRIFAHLTVGCAMGAILADASIIGGTEWLEKLFAQIVAKDSAEWFIQSGTILWTWHVLAAALGGGLAWFWGKHTETHPSSKAFKI
jgi:hypothetical protein